MDSVGTESQELAFTPTLESLPNEVLNEIFFRVDSETLTTTPLSKRLNPFQQGTLHRSIEVDCENQVALYNTAVANQNPCFVHTKCLVFSSESRDEGRRGDSDNDFRELEDEDLLAIFKSMPNVTVLVVGHSIRVFEMLCSAEAGSSSFSKLRSLTALYNSDELDPLDPVYLPYLAQYTSLRVFFVTAFCTRQRASLSAVQPGISLSVTDFTMHSDLGSPGRVPAILSAMPLLTRLSVINGGPSPNFSPLLASLPSPDKLLTLRLEAHGSRSHRNITDVLPLFSALKRLSLGNSLASMEPEFYSALRRIPLRTLTFTGSGKIGLAHLATLLLPPSQHPSLRLLKINLTRGLRGRQIASQGHLRIDVLDRFSSEDVLSGWELPVWGWSTDNEADTSSTFRAFLAAVKRSSVTISGMAVDALSVEDDYRREQALVVKYRAARARGEQPVTVEELEALDAAAKEEGQ
ncbi:hypothetical protein JCM6882_008254 [Rhodosporidiobolus microsporus]